MVLLQPGAVGSALQSGVRLGSRVLQAGSVGLVLQSTMISAQPSPLEESEPLPLPPL